MSRVRTVPGLGERLQEALYKSEYGPYQLEKLTGVNHSNICNYINGTMAPSVYTIYALCDILNVSADYLIFGKEKCGK